MVVPLIADCWPIPCHWLPLPSICYPPLLHSHIVLHCTLHPSQQPPKNAFPVPSSFMDPARKIFVIACFRPTCCIINLPHGNSGLRSPPPRFGINFRHP